MTKRPNFILYITDQHRADYLGCYGHPVLKTPHIDAMAANGVRFENFYVNSPVCMPNRASLMTCRRPNSHGVRFNGIPLSTREVTFVELLRDAGYDTALIGKSHLQNFTGNPAVLKRPDARPGFHQAEGSLSEAYRHDLSDDTYAVEGPAFWAGETPRVPTPFYGFDHVELVTGHGDRIGGDYTEWLLAREPDAESLIGPKNQLPHEYVCPQAVRTAVPEALYSTTYIAERAEAWLQEREGADRPFFLMVSWPDPHHPFNPPGRYWDMYKPEEMALPEAFDRNDWVPPAHVANIHAARENGTANEKGMISIGCSAQEALEARALTCGMIAMIDDAVGRIQGALSAAGGADNTVTLFTADHGDHLGDHRLLLKGAEQYDQLTRVPFIWSDPKGESGGRTERFAQTSDIGTSVLERARGEKAFGMQGADIIGGEESAYALIQYCHQVDVAGFDFPPNVHTIRAESYRLSVMANMEEGELYDLKDDPGEFNNLWDDAGYTPVKLRLLELLVRAEIAAVDTVPIPTRRA